MASFSSVWGDLRESLQEVGKPCMGRKWGIKGKKLGLKIVQVKGVMPFFDRVKELRAKDRPKPA